MRPIVLRGARTNNLKGVDLDIDPGTLLVVCGPSGAGKSSLAFGTLYAEGQRRYVESFSAYARQFLERLARPPVDALEWVPPAIAVDRAAPVKSSRSTVATMTEISDYAKHLWALAASLDCAACGAPVRGHSASSAADELLARAADAPVVLAYPVAVANAERYLEVRDALVASGYRRVWLDGEVRDLDQVAPSQVVGDVAAPSKAPAASDADAAGDATATLHVVVDRTRAQVRERDRIVEAFETAFARGDGEARAIGPEGRAWSFSRALRCDACGAQYRRPHAGAFSYDSPIGACETCRGFGRSVGVGWDRVMPDHGKSLAEGAIRPWAGKSATYERKLLRRYCERAGISMTAPLRDLGDEVVQKLIDGDGGNWRTGYPGLKRWFKWLESRAYKMHVRVLLSRYRSYDPCEACGGGRFKPGVAGWKVGGATLPTFYSLAADKAYAFLDGARHAHAGDASLTRLFDECLSRLGALCDVGLGYLTLDRSARSLSGGELQRVALTSALGSSLTGTLFVLDEPTVGLHPQDAARLLGVVRRLRADDNIVVVVESESAFVTGADRVVELGPGGGATGGEIVFDGAPDTLARGTTPTARALRPTMRATRARRKPSGELVLTGASGNNLRDAELRLPLGVLTCVTGVSGSGKSSLILDTLAPALARARGETAEAPLPFAKLDLRGKVGPLVLVDQAPLGRTGRGNPATYSGCWDALRKHLARTPLARMRGYGPGTFSFNVPGGRCEACKGEGAETVEMQFLADVHLSCPQCGGRRFTGSVLDVELDGKNAADMLEMTVADAARQFGRIKEVARCLAPLIDVGIGYLRLGQPLNTLSGGEAQRLRLAAALGEAGKRSFVVLDEPTAGLHALDAEPLMLCFDRLVDAGGTVVVVEHEMRVAAHADHVIDLGPGAGVEGGRVVASGTPEEVAASPQSRTAPYLRRALGLDVAEAPPVRPARTRGDDDGQVVRVRGAREHNLRRVDVDVPRERLVVVTGPSGSGKSTLAFDVIFAESQRRYLETLPPYVRQYLKQLPRAAVDSVSGMPPGVALEQRQTGGGVNSTVATVTEVAHYLRLLFARAGLLHCPTCAIPIAPRPSDVLAADVRKTFRDKVVSVLSPVVRGRKGHHRELLDRLQAQGVVRARIDGEWRALKPGMGLARYKEHDVDVVLGAAVATSKEFQALLERALALGEGTAQVSAGTREMLLSSRRACATCGRGFPELDPRFFSFNTRQGACEQCEGAGVVERAVRGGESVFETCPACKGGRLAGLALHTTVAGLHIGDILSLSVERALARLARVRLEGRERVVGERALREALARLGFLDRVGLSYLALDRPARSLSGGEMQRVRLAAQLGAGLTGVLYVLDEPTIGLHARDTGRLLAALRALVDQGCSVLVVEHDADTIRAADRVIDMGPGGGHLGGRIVAQGSPAQLLKDPASVTGAALARPLRIPERRRPVARAGPWLVLRDAREHNLHGVNLRVPVGRLVVVTGISGSGKSTLVRSTLLRAVRQALGLQTEAPGAHAALEGAEVFARALEIDQTPIGRTPRSVPATYIGIWDEIRKLFAQSPDARAKGWTASRFSFNVAAGSCPACEGQGLLRVEMAFLPDAHVRCEECEGQRFDPATLTVKLRGLNAGQLLDLHVDEAVELLAGSSKIRQPLELLCQLGLGYLTLGQASNTLSGGEAQRLKLVSELSSPGAGRALYVMDEPTTGLHRDDVARLMSVLDALVDRGDTLVVIEHHPDVIASADWVVDLGPEGGEHGGRIIAEGTPETLMRSRTSHTGEMLRRELGGSVTPVRAAAAGPPARRFR